MSPAVAKARAFIAAFSRCGNITKAAEAVGIDRGMHYRWILNPKYAADFKKAEDQFGDVLEGEAIRRANEGVLEPVFYQGEPCGAIRVFSDGLMLGLLKRFKPDKYSQRINADVNITGTLDLVQRLNAARKRASEHDDHSAPGKPGPG